MSDFSPITGMDSMINDGETRAAAISEQFVQGFITEDERYRLTIDN